MTATLRLSRMHYPVKVLGFGTRVGVWTQGCSIGCRGCISQDTWDKHGGALATVDQVVDRCATWAAGDAPFDGVTISGGEPFDQPDALLELLDRLGEWLGTRRESIDLLCYSGYSEPRLRRRYGTILRRLDALIPGPYVSRKAPGGPWRGSSNQPIVPLTRLGEERYGQVVDPGRAAKPEMQFVVDDGIWFIGVPRPGDLERLEMALEARGVRLDEASWR